MSTMVRDPWADARQAATEEVLDPDVAAVRRRLRQRWAARLVLGLALVVLVVLGIGRLIGRSLDDVGLPSADVGVAWGLFGLSVVLLVVGLVRTTGGGTADTVVTPADYLDRTGRRWLRRAVADGTPVPDERREVVLDAARRAARATARLPQQLAWIVMLGGLLAIAPQGPLLVLFPLALVYQVAVAVQEQVRARQARRWLALHG